MKSNGTFCYKPASCSMTTIEGSSTYNVENSYGKYSTTKVIINYKCHLYLRKSKIRNRVTDESRAVLLN